MNKKLYLRSIILLLLSSLIITDPIIAEDNSSTEIKIITVEQATTLIDKNKNNSDFIILDVRTTEEFNSGHISNATNIDYKSADFKKKVSKLNRNKTYVTYCRSGRRSTSASEIMAEIGFEDIYMIEGGFVAWDKANLPTDK